LIWIQPDTNEQSELSKYIEPVRFIPFLSFVYYFGRFLAWHVARREREGSHSFISADDGDDDDGRHIYMCIGGRLLGSLGKL
jgi:hypothetical protein